MRTFLTRKVTNYIGMTMGGDFNPDLARFY